MQDVTHIEIAFDNGEIIQFNISELEDFLLRNITRSIAKFAGLKTDTYLLAEEVKILINKEANQPSAFTEDFEDGKNTPFQRLLSGGIAAIDIFYENDAESETVYVPCKQEAYGRNEYETISELENGNLLIVIKPH